MAADERVLNALAQVVPSVRADRGMVRDSIAVLRSSPQHFYAERGGSVLAARTDDMAFSPKKQSILLVWLGEGEGVALFNEWLAWVAGRKAIRMASFTPLFDHDALPRFMARKGFARCGGMYIWERK